MKDIVLLLPPLTEQSEILSYLAGATGSIGVAVECTRGQIDLVREYRTRLIADVVTGKLDVREAAAQLPDNIEEVEPFEETEADAELDTDAADDTDAIPEEAEA